MAQRVIVGLQPDADWASVGAALVRHGAVVVHGPLRELPDAAVVTAPGGADLDAFLLAVRKLAGVRYAEADAWQSTS